MSKKFDIHKWILSIKYWSLIFIPHISICLIYILYILIGASLIQDIESNEVESSSSIKTFQQERERFLLKIIEKRDILDLEQYTKYVYKQIRQYEEEMKKQITSEENSSFNFSQSLVLISATLTTIGKNLKLIFLLTFVLMIYQGSNEFLPKTKIGKLFLIIYTAFGIPLTLIFLTDLSCLIKQFIEYILFIYSYIYSSKYFLYIRRFLFFRFIEEEEMNLPRISFNNDNNLTITQLMFTLFIYLLLGTYLIPSKTFFESFYLCFTALFTIHLNTKLYQNNNLFIFLIYLFFGLAIVLLCIKALQKTIEQFFANIGRKLLRNLVELTRQMGFHDFNTDDLFAYIDPNSLIITESIISRHQNFTRSMSLEQQLTLRPIGVAEPLRRLSTGLIRAFKNNEIDENKHLDKSVQVTTIIRRCGRCAEACLPIQPVRKHSVISSSSSSMTDTFSSYDDDDNDVMDFPPPNLDRVRQRRATLVAKTIISQMATQPRSSSIDELMTPLPSRANQRLRTANSSPSEVTCSVQVSTSIPPDSLRKRNDSEVEFIELSRQISALITANDDDEGELS